MIKNIYAFCLIWISKLSLETKRKATFGCLILVFQYLAKCWIIFSSKQYKVRPMWVPSQASISIGNQYPSLNVNAYHWVRNESESLILLLVIRSASSISWLVSGVNRSWPTAWVFDSAFFQLGCILTPTYPIEKVTLWEGLVDLAKPPRVSPNFS